MSLSNRGALSLRGTAACRSDRRIRSAYRTGSIQGQWCNIWSATAPVAR